MNLDLAYKLLVPPLRWAGPFAAWELGDHTFPHAPLLKAGRPLLGPKTAGPTVHLTRDYRAWMDPLV